MKKRNLLALVLGVVMVLSLALSGCSDPAPSGGETSNPEATPGASTGAETYHIGYTKLGSGVFPLEQYELGASYLLQDVTGNNFESVVADFSADKMQNDVQSMISAGSDGIMYFGAFGALNTVVGDMCRDSEVYFAMWDQMPLENQVEAMLANPYFAGAVGLDAYNQGLRMGQIAADAGNRAAIICGAALGDPVADANVQGFTDAFTAAGGEVIGVARCSDPSEITAKCDDLVAANPDADCVYGTNLDYYAGAYNALNNANRTLKGYYCSNVGPEQVEQALAGTLVGDGGTFSLDSALSACLLLNAIDGHPILDENGNPPIISIVPMLMDQSNAAEFKTYCFDQNPLPEEVYKSLLWRYNNDVTYNDYVELLNDLSVEYIVGLNTK